MARSSKRDTTERTRKAILSRGAARSPAQHPAGTWTILAPILIIAAAITAHFGGFDGKFFFDDDKQITNNKRIQSVTPLAETLSGRRPIVDLSLALNYKYGREDGKLDPWGFHLWNLTVHILAALTLFGIVRRTSLCERYRGRFGAAAPWLALCIALLWVVHPLQTGAVTYLIQRAESMMGLAYLLTLYCVIRGAHSRLAIGWYATAVAACSMGMGCKGIMVTAPLTVLIYDWVFLASSSREILRRRWGLYVALAATWIVLAQCGVVTGVLDPSRRTATVGFSYKGISPMAYLATQPGVLVHYLYLSLWPNPLCLDYAWPVTRNIQAIIAPALLVLSLLAGTAWGLARRSWLGFAGVWFFVILAPTSTFIPIKDTAFEHRMYLPLAAVIALVVVGFAAALRSVARRTGLDGETVMTVSIAVAVLLAGLLVGGTVRRNRIYFDPLGMWTDVAVKRPTSGRAHLGMGTALFQMGEQHDASGDVDESRRLFFEASQAFSSAVKYRPRYSDAHYNLGNALAKLGKYAEAVAAYRQAVRFNPRHAKSHYNLGNALKRLNLLDEAIEAFQETIRRDPSHRSAHINLGNTLRAVNRLDEAIAIYHEALLVDPRYANTHFNLGVALQRQGHIREAQAEYEAALKFDPDHREATRALDAIRNRRSNP